MQAVVSLLDDTHQSMVEFLQSRLEGVLGVVGLFQTPVAHISYQVAEEFDPEHLTATLLKVAATTKPFKVHTSGFGLFTRVLPVLYVPVARSPSLQTQHLNLWQSLSPAAHHLSPYYHPDRWLPHITLSDHEDLPDYLPDITRLLSSVDLTWEIEITNVAMLYGDGKSIEVKFRRELSGNDI